MRLWEVRIVWQRCEQILDKNSNTVRGNLTTKDIGEMGQQRKRIIHHLGGRNKRKKILLVLVRRTRPRRGGQREENRAGRWNGVKEEENLRSAKGDGGEYFLGA